MGGPATFSSVIGSPSGSLQISWIVVAVPGAIERENVGHTGAPLVDGVTVIETVSVAEWSVPSKARNVNESGPS